MAKFDKDGLKELDALKEHEVFRSRLIEFYNKHCPDNLARVDQTLKQWQGREDELFSELRKKYLGAAEVKQMQDEDFETVVTGLKKIYKTKCLPIEQAYKFDRFFSPYLTDVDFDAKPMVLLLGQYSVGKTTFIRYLVERDFPGMRIGPEPTTDRFTAIMHAKEDQVIPGNALCVANDKPFRALTMFGTQFMNRMEASCCSSKLLESITLIDTPGVLAGEKQRLGRQYDFPQVVEWFASRCDRILLLFDAHKLDISDEFKRVMMACKGHDEKIRVVLNKADSIGEQALMRVYGALMWSMGKVITTPEALRVYIGSFWHKPLNPEHQCLKLFESEHADLLADLRSLPRNSAIRKVNELVKRARLAKVHAYIINHLKKEMPAMFGKAKKQQKLLENLGEEFARISQRERIPPGDFPDINRFRTTLAEFDISKFPKLNEKALQKIDTVLSQEIPVLMKQMRVHNQATVDEAESCNPFGDDEGYADPAGTGWDVGAAQKTTFDNMFHSAKLNNGKLQGKDAKDIFASTGLPNSKLFKIWKVADVDGDGALDSDEFAVAMYIVDQLNNHGGEIPDVLPPSLIPPSKRDM